MIAALIVFSQFFIAVNYLLYSTIGAFAWELIGSGPLSSDESRK